MDERILKEATRLAIKTLSEQLDKSVTGTQTANQLHGVNGLFNVQGLERDIISAMITPKGIASVLNLIPSVYENPMFGTITGYTDAEGDEPTNACEDAPHGYMKSAVLTAQFGLTRRDTNEIDITQAITKANRGDMTDLVLRGRLLGEELKPGSLDVTKVLNVLTKSEMVGAGVQAQRKLSKDIWRGTVAAGSFPGLDSLISINHVDAMTGTIAPALDSYIKEFGYSDVSGTAKDIVEYLSMMEYYLRYNAEGAGLDPVKFAVAMTPSLWFELSAVWPSNYMTNRGLNAAGTNVMVINDDNNVKMRDDMRARKVIPINGTWYPVVTDTGIFEHNNINNANLSPGEFASSIYMVPLTIQDNMPVTYMEYLDFRAADADVSLLKQRQDFWTDSGIYTWAIQQQLWCYKLALMTKQRIVLKTPQLAGKIQHVKYTPIDHLRQAYPEDPYFKDGGVSLRSGTWGQANWR